MPRFVPVDHAIIDRSLGVLTPLWRRYFEDLDTDVTSASLALATALAGTHADRLTYVAADYDDILFYETDRRMFYRSDGANWVWLAGQMHDTHANRPIDLGVNDVGFRFWASDRTVEHRWSGTAWVYRHGQMRDTRANAPTDLGANDAGFLFYVSDFHHRVRWDGSAWQWACGCRPAQFGDFAVAPGDGWVLCDGTATTYLGGVGTAALTAVAFTPPNLSGSPAYKKSGAAYAGTINAAGGASSSDGAHTHGAGTLAGPSHTHSISASGTHTHGDGTLATGANDDFAVVEDGLTEIVAADPHTHDVTGSTAAGGDHSHGGATGASGTGAVTGSTASDGAHTHGIGTLDPQHLVVLPYMRR